MEMFLTSRRVIDSGVGYLARYSTRVGEGGGWKKSLRNTPIYLLVKIPG